MAEENGKIKTDPNDRTNVENIYAIGDVAYDKPELTPVASKAGALLSKRLFTKSTELMDYNMVPTTIFTPIEIGTIGYSEEAAKKKFGAENLEVHHKMFRPLEWAISKDHHKLDEGYIKLISNKADKDRIVGWHLVAPNAGEVT